MLLNELSEPLDAKYCLVALCRLLLSSSPVEAEYAWDKLGPMAASPDKWFEVRRGTTVHYQRGAEAVRFSHDVPKVPTEDLGRIVESLYPPNALRDYLGWLADSMSEQALRFKARARSNAINGMDVAFERKELAAFLSGAAKPGFAESFSESLRRRYVHFGIPGTLAGRLLLLVSIAEAGHDRPALAKALRMPGRLNVLDAVAFTDDMLGKIARLDSGIAWIAKASGDMKEQAGSLQEQAFKAQTDGEYYGDIFLSAPPAYAAYFGFECLSRMKDNPDRERHRRLQILCQERTAAATAAMMVHFLDSVDGRQLLTHRSRVERLRATEGDDAAIAAAEQYVDVDRLYPPFYRPFLLGETDILATSAPPAETAPPPPRRPAAGPPPSTPVPKAPAAPAPSTEARPVVERQRRAEPVNPKPAEAAEPVDDPAATGRRKRREREISVTITVPNSGNGLVARQRTMSFKLGKPTDPDGASKSEAKPITLPDEDLGV